MAVPTTGPVTMAQICAEFGAPANTPLHNFVRGGSWVPNASPNLGVPTSPPITIDDLRGAADYTPMSGSMGDLNGGSANGLWNTIGTATCSVSGGNPSKSYTFSIINDPTPTNFQILSVSGNQATVQGKSRFVGVSVADLKCVVDDGDNSIDVLCDLTYERV